MGWYTAAVQRWRHGPIQHVHHSEPWKRYGGHLLELLLDRLRHTEDGLPLAVQTLQKKKQDCQGGPRKRHLVADLAHGNTQPLWPEVLRLRRWLQSRNIQLSHQCRDTIKWNHEASGVYTTSSVYNFQFQVSIKSRFRQLFWQAWAPGRLKFFAWLLHKNRLWCNDRLQRRGWPYSYFCQMCLRNPESSEHLF